MLVYRPHDELRARHVIFVQPGRFYRESDWLDEGGNPRMFTVVFKKGRAEVPDNLGKYLIDQGQAQSSPIILPEGIGRHA